MDIGTHLREARQRQGVTLRQIADSTKLSTTTLQHIERNELDRLPGGIFTKGYLRAYAAEVGVNPQEVVNEYLAQFPAAVTTEELPIVRAPAIENPRDGRRLLSGVAAIVLALVIYGSLQDFAESPATSSRELVQASAPIASLVTESVASGAWPATERHERGLRLEIQPTGECWVCYRPNHREQLPRVSRRLPAGGPATKGLGEWDMKGGCERQVDSQRLRAVHSGVRASREAARQDPSAVRDD